MRIVIAAFFISCILSCNSSDDNNKTSADSPGTLSDETGESMMKAMQLVPEQLPPSIKFQGNVEQAWTWNDQLGNNILILAALPPKAVKVQDMDGDASTLELFAYHYAGKETDYKLLWRLNDLVKACEFDNTAKFLEGATSITDLDQDGIAETTIQYKLACRSDVSPAYMKLIMHEDSVKYSLKGSMWVYTGSAEQDSVFLLTENDANLEKIAGYKGTDDDYLKSFGRYESEKDFIKAPSSFLVFARKQWLKFAKENFE